MSYLLAGAYQVTSDLSAVTAYSRDGATPPPLFDDGFESGSTGS